MDIKNLEALSQLKKQMKEEAKSKYVVKPSPKFESVQKQKCGDDESRIAREAHRAELKAAKKQYKEQNDNHDSKTVSDNSFIGGISPGELSKEDQEWYDASLRSYNNREDKTSYPVKSVSTKMQTKQKETDYKEILKEKKKDNFFSHVTAAEFMRQMELDGFVKDYKDVARVKRVSSLPVEHKVETPQTKVNPEEENRLRKEGEELSRQRALREQEEQARLKLEQERQSSEQSSRMMMSSYQSLRSKLNEADSRIKWAEGQATKAERDLKPYDEKLRLKEMQIQTEKNGIHSSTGDAITDKIRDISVAVNKHRNLEQSKYIRIPAICRVSSKCDGVFWLTNCEGNSKYGMPLAIDGPVYSKNSDRGLDVINFIYSYLGSSKYNDAVQWDNYSNGIKELEFKFNNNPQKYQYQSLRVLLDQLGASNYKLTLLERDRLLIIRDRNQFANKVKHYSDVANTARLEKENLDKRIKELKAKLDIEAEKREKWRLEEEKLKQDAELRLKDDKRRLEEEKFRLEEELRIKQEEENRRLEEEKFRLEEELRLKEIEEQRRLEDEERLKKEAEEKERENQKVEQEIAKLNRSIEEQKEKIKIARSFIREANNLRSQHLLDPNQENAKRSHFFDGVPVVIEGGPGTGKTTTIIQRLKFLLSPEAFRERKNVLTSAQRDDLLDPNKIDLMWLFISPTKPLLHYLRQNMVQEGLMASERNTKTMGKFRNDIFSYYKLSGTFKIIDYIDSDEYEPLILDPLKALRAFEDHIISNIKNDILSICSIKSSDFDWNDKAIRIKASCKRAQNVFDLKDIISVINQIKNNELENIQEADGILQKSIDMMSFNVLKAVENSKESKQKFEEMFTRWKSDKDGLDDESNLYDIEDDSKFMSVDFVSEFYSKLKPLIRKISVKQYGDVEVKLTPKEEEFYHDSEPLINTEIEKENKLVQRTHEDFLKVHPEMHDAKVEQTLYQKIGSLAYFILNFGNVCRGLDIVFLQKLPVLYKSFRAGLISSDADFYDKKLLEKILSKNSGKRIHPDELDMLVGYINHVLCALAVKNNAVFKSLKHKFVKAYLENMKPVIGVDEATDYTLLDYYLISSFLHYEYSSLTMCGDIMQGLNKNGIGRWKDLEPIIDKTIDVAELKTSYRQLPTLVDMSRSMYFDDQGSEAPFTSSKERSDNDPRPLCFISDDEDEKAEWIAKRIHDVYLSYDKHMPSVAIFLDPNDRKNTPKDFIRRLKDYDDYLNGILVEDCTDNRQAEGTDLVRVFYLNEVKGMEFEVAFFHNIDTAFSDADTKLLRRYLYVGVSRATTHLAATFTDEDGNEDILKYFDREAEWI